MAQQLLVGWGLLISEASRSLSDTPHSVGPLWTRDQPVAETSTLQYITTDRQPRPRRDSNPQSQQGRGRSSTPSIALTLGSVSGCKNRSLFRYRTMMGFNVFQRDFWIYPLITDDFGGGVLSLSLSEQRPGYFLKLGHDRFLPHNSN
jgi:hypothetical protein